MLKLRRKLIGGILVEQGVLTAEQLEIALADQRRSPGRRLGDILMGLRAISENQLLRALSQQLDCPIIDLVKEPPDRNALGIVPSEFAMRHNLIPLRQNDEQLVVAMADPLDIQALDDLTLLTGLDIALMLATSRSVTTPHSSGA